MDMQELLREWQKRLHLEDWRVTLEDNCSPADMDNQDNRGEVLYCESIKGATIKLIDENADSKYSIEPYDKEQVLVHELLHLKFMLLDNSDNEIQNRIVHQLVDEIARVLVEVKKIAKAS